MANNINPDKVYKEFGVKTGEDTSEFFEVGADARNIFIQNAEHTRYGDVDGIVDLQTKLDNFNKSIRNIGSGNAANNYATAFGYGTSAEGEASYAEGKNTRAVGLASHVEGYGTVAKGLHSHVEGLNNQEQGNTNHIEGDRNILQGNLNHIEGFSNNIIGDGLHIEGCGNIAYLEPQTQVYFASLPLSITAYGSDIVIDNSEVVTLGQEENIDGRLYKYMISAEISIPNIAQTSSSSLEELVNSSIWRGSCVIPRDSSSHPYVIFKKDTPLGSGTYVFKIYFQTYPEYSYIGTASFNIKEVQKIRTISEKQQFGIGSHVQGKYCTVQSNLAHIVGGGSSNDDRKNIHILDWDGNAEFAGDVTIFGCGGSDPIQLSAWTKGPLIIQESMIEEYSGQGKYGDKILDAIQKNRQILILLNNQGGSLYSLYSPVITYHLPYEANTKLSLFYLPDGMSPTNFTIKEAQFMVSNPITFNDNLKN